MLRSLTAIGIALALVGSAHAQEPQITVSLHGKSSATIKAELYRAAERVCVDDTSIVVDPLDTSCVEASYADAMKRFRGARQLARTALVQPAQSGVR